MSECEFCADCCKKLKFWKTNGHILEGQTEKILFKDVLCPRCFAIWSDWFFLSKQKTTYRHEVQRRHVIHDRVIGFQYAKSSTFCW